jgi:hypothetical protein
MVYPWRAVPSRAETEEITMSPLRAVCAVLVVALLAVPASATPKPKPPVYNPTLQLLTELHHAHRLLQEANHDYDGHRAKAAEELHKAIKTLEATVPHHHHQAQPTAKPVVKEPAVHEPQAVSDAQLREARKVLKTVEAQLASSTELHHQKALVDVAKAIEQIDIALKIR